MTRLGDLFGGADDAPATFLGVPAADLDSLDADVVVIGAPVATPYRSLGAYAAGAPAAIRAGARDFARAASHFDFDLGRPLLDPDTGPRVVDAGDVEGHPEDAPGNRARITAAVAAVRRSGAVPVVIGGDDSVPIPLFAAFEGGGPYTVVQIDAHIDWRDEIDGERFGLSSPMRRASEMPWIERIVQVGARGPGSARRRDYEDALAWGARFVAGREFAARGVDAVLDLVADGSRVLFTLDCDGLDPAIMPAVIGPAPGGLDYWSVVEIIHGIAAKARIAAFDIVEFMPARDPDGLAALTAARIVANAIAAATSRG